MIQHDEVYLCPACGTAAIDFSVIGSEASCRKCHWSGLGKEVLKQQFKHTHGTQEEITQAFLRDFKTMFAAHAATVVGRLLVKWGFLPATHDMTKVLGRYLTVAAQAMVKAILEERDKIERES